MLVEQGSGTSFILCLPWTLLKSPERQPGAASSRLLHYFPSIREKHWHPSGSAVDAPIGPPADQFLVHQPGDIALQSQLTGRDTQAGAHVHVHVHSPPREHRNRGFGVLLSHCSCKMHEEHVNTLFHACINDRREARSQLIKDVSQIKAHTAAVWSAHIRLMPNPNHVLFQRYLRVQCSRRAE